LQAQYVGTEVRFRKIEIKELAPGSKKPEKTAEPGWIPLFNGKDLAGWKKHQPKRSPFWYDGSWQVKDGILVGTAGNLFSTGGDYDNFHLRFERQGERQGGRRPLVPQSLF